MKLAKDTKPSIMYVLLCCSERHIRASAGYVVLVLRFPHDGESSDEW
jgi:hypothetical protein